MRVAMIHTPFTGSGGGERQILMLARELEKAGNEVTIFSNYLDSEKCFPKLVAGLDIRVISPGPGWSLVTNAGRVARNPSLQRTSMVSIGRRIPSGFDVLNCHNYYSSWPSAIAKKRLGIPSVWMCNDPPFWYHTPQYRYAWQKWSEGALLRAIDYPTARAMDAIVVLDQKNVERVSRIYRRKAVLIRSGVDSEFFDNEGRLDRRKALGLEGKFVILMVNHAAPWKGQREAIQALARLGQDIPSIHLILVGGGISYAYSALIKELGLEDRVTILEGLSDDDLAEIYVTANVFIHPANYTWGLNATEAMAASRPVIVADQTGVSDIIEHGVNGLVVEYGSVEDLATQIKRLYEDPRMCREIGAAGKDYVRKNLTWRAYAEHMLTVFESCGPGHKRTARA